MRVQPTVIDLSLGSFSERSPRTLLKERAFHDRFRDEAAHIMAKYDFNIVAMWEPRTSERTEFIYLLEWPDEATMKDRWAKDAPTKEAVLEIVSAFMAAPLYC